jgi:hypothetical protein
MKADNEKHMLGRSREADFFRVRKRLLVGNSRKCKELENRKSKKELDKNPDLFIEENHHNENNISYMTTATYVMNVTWQNFVNCKKIP